MQVDVYEIACSNLGIERLETPEQLADLYEYVTSRYDVFNEETDKWPTWADEMETLRENAYKQGKEGWSGPLRTWVRKKLFDGSDVRSVVYFLLDEFGLTWEEVRRFLILPGSNLESEMSEMEDWEKLQTLIRENPDGVRAIQVRRTLGLSGAPDYQTLRAVVRRMGGIWLNAQGEPQLDDFDPERGWT